MCHSYRDADNGITESMIICPPCLEAYLAQHYPGGGNHLSVRAALGYEDQGVGGEGVRP